MQELGYIYVLVSTIFAAFSGIAAKKVLRDEHSVDYALFASGVGFLILLPFLPFIDLAVSWRELGLIFLASLLGATSLYFGWKAMRHLSLSTAAPLGDLSLISTVVLAVFFLGEIPNVNQWLGIGLIILGAYLLEAYPGKLDLLYPLRELKSSHYIHLLLGSIALASVAALIGRITLESVPPGTYLFFVYLFLFLVHAVLYFVVARERFSVALTGIQKNFSWFAVGAITRLAGSFLYVNAVALIYIGLAEAIHRLSTLVSVVLGGRLFKEENLLWKTFASVVMISGVIVIFIS